MSELNPKDGDIYRWSWTDEELKKRKDQISSGTLYWCCSRICVFKEGKFWDTYWGYGSSEHNKRFSIEDAAQKLSLSYVGNFEDLIEASKSDRAYYENADCVDISHANMMRGGFYVRKGANKSLDKMRRIMKRQIAKYEREAEYAKNQAERFKHEINSLTVDSYVPYDADVSLSDHSYEDEK